MPAPDPVSPASYTASTSAQRSPASANASLAEIALICHVDVPGARRAGYS